jgi:hydrogenase nickel incorporation protein HypA/HybF
MHELSLMAGLLRQIEEAALASGAGRVTAVSLKVGELAGVEPALLSGAFDLLAPGTVAEGASLDIEHVPLTAECESCGPFRVERFRFRCPSCGGAGTRVVAGEDVILESLVVESGRPAVSP